MSIGLGSLILAGAGIVALGVAIGPADGEEPTNYAEEKAAAETRIKVAAITGLVLIPLGLVFLIRGQVRFHRQQEADAERLSTEYKLEVERRHRHDRELAETLTQEASTAARARDCKLVVVRAGAVHGLDVEFFETVFLRDPAIRICYLAAAKSTDLRLNRAVTLMRAAAEAARKGDCTNIFDLERRVLELDATVHDVWFVHDRAIQACLEQARLGPSTPVTPDVPAVTPQGP